MMMECLINSLEATGSPTDESYARTISAILEMRGQDISPKGLELEQASGISLTEGVETTLPSNPVIDLLWPKEPPKKVLTIRLARQANEELSEMPDHINIQSLLNFKKAKAQERAFLKEEVPVKWIEFLESLSKTQRAQLLASFSRAALGIYNQDSIERTGAKPKVNPKPDIKVREFRKLYDRISPEKIELHNVRVAFTALAFKKDFPEGLEEI